MTNHNNYDTPYMYKTFFSHMFSRYIAKELSKEGILKMHIFNLNC